MKVLKLPGNVYNLAIAIQAEQLIKVHTLIHLTILMIVH